MRILIEVGHTTVDYDIIASCPDHSFVGAFCDGWDAVQRPKPPNIEMQLEPKGNFDMIIVGSWHRAEMLRKVEAPMIFRQITDYGRWVFPPEILDRVSRVVFPCPESLERWGLAGHPKGAVIEHPIDADVFSGYRGDGGDVLTVGNMIPVRPERRPDLLEAVDKEVHVDLVGFGNEGMRSDIGRARDRDHLAEFYRSYKVFYNHCDVVVCATLEAMAAGMPVVTIRPGNFVDFMRDAWNCVIVDNPQQAVAQIRTLLRDGNLRRIIGERARESIMGRLHRSIHKRKWNALLEEVRQGWRR